MDRPNRTGRATDTVCANEFVRGGYPDPRVRHFLSAAAVNGAQCDGVEGADPVFTEFASYGVDYPLYDRDVVDRSMVRSRFSPPTSWTLLTGTSDRTGQSE